MEVEKPSNYSWTIKRDSLVPDGVSSLDGVTAGREIALVQGYRAIARSTKSKMKFG